MSSALYTLAIDCFLLDTSSTYRWGVRLEVVSTSKWWIRSLADSKSCDLSATPPCLLKLQGKRKRKKGRPPFFGVFKNKRHQQPCVSFLTGGVGDSHLPLHRPFGPAGEGGHPPRSLEGCSLLLGTELAETPGDRGKMMRKQCALICHFTK